MGQNGRAGEMRWGGMGGRERWERGGKEEGGSRQYTGQCYVTSTGVDYIMSTLCLNMTKTLVKKE